ncbi:MAG: glycosyltransferase family 2 protein [Pedobacter sp.]|nr:glycosyltransferase family 2 protein [Chitinophagaceae bacterium]
MVLSILIRNLNEATALETCLKALALQQVNSEYEVVVVDNESNDNSVAIATQYGCKVVTMPRQKFSYGGAINFGINHCKAPLILILSAHVFLLNDNFLQQIPTHFTNEKVVGLRFINSLNADAVTGAFNKPQQTITWQTEQGNVAAIWQKTTVNHCAAIRKNTWQQYPYNEVIISGEDKLWAYEVLKSGYAITVNIPLFYTYHKPMSRAQLIQKRAQEEVALILVTGVPFKNYPTSFKATIKYAYGQFWAAVKHIKTYCKTTKYIKEILPIQKQHFKL